jgi:hypothetical protein
VLRTRAPENGDRSVKLAEREGFEPSNGFIHYSYKNAAALPTATSPYWKKQRLEQALGLRSKSVFKSLVVDDMVLCCDAISPKIKST